MMVFWLVNSCVLGFRVGEVVLVVVFELVVLVVVVMVFLLFWLRGVALCWRSRLGLVVFCGLL